MFAQVEPWPGLLRSGVRGSEPLIRASYGSLPETLLSDTREVPRTLSSAARRRPTVKGIVLATGSVAVAALAVSVGTPPSTSDVALAIAR